MGRIITFTIGALLFFSGIGLILIAPTANVVLVEETIGFAVCYTGFVILISGIGIFTR